MAMGAAKDTAATFQHEIVCLDELVPADDLYRRLDRLVDWGFIRAAAAPYYAEAGRPSVDPIVLVKLMLVGALEGIGSMREALRQAGLRLDLRRFLGYGLGERLPVHQTVSLNQTRRFVDGQLFERLFGRSVRLCDEHGLLEGTHLSIDGFHAEANAALASLRASLGPAPEAEPGDEGPPTTPGPAPEPPQLRLAPPPARRAPTPPRRSSNATSRSLTDPDARLRHRPGQRPHLVLRGQVAVDPKARCVVACRGEGAGGHEGDALGPLLDRTRFHCPALRSAGADQGYAAERVYADLARRGLAAYIPPQPNMLPRPGAAPASQGQRLALAARARTKTPAGIWAHARRMADAEGVISEAKLEGTMARARCRGIPLFHVQVLIDCTAINCKRLARLAGAASGMAAGPAAAALAAPAGPERLPSGTGADSLRPSAGRPPTPVLWAFAACLN